MRKYAFKAARPHKKSKKKKFGLFFLFFAAILIAMFNLLVNAFHKSLMPSALEMARLEAETRMNDALGEAIQKSLTGSGIKSEDFYTESIDEKGAVNSLSVNAVLVNSVCSDLAVEVSDSLRADGDTSVGVPIGVLFGIDSLANLVPRYNVLLAPAGNATVDYSTNITSAGINQVEFQLWLDVRAKIKVVNPLQSENFEVNRKILLVNAVFAGDVPSFYNNPQ
jgi:sporulation protein YunB